MNPWLVVPAVALLAVFYVLLPVAYAMASRHRAAKIVRCPVAGNDAVIRVGRAGLAEAFGRRSLRRVESCALWPDRLACARACLELPDEAMHDAGAAA